MDKPERKLTMDLGEPIKKGTVIPVTRPISVPVERPARVTPTPAPVKEKEPADV